jgi:photosystem II stability/assembly factor-like uncharacterized protein
MSQLRTSVPLLGVILLVWVSGAGIAFPGVRHSGPRKQGLAAQSIVNGLSNPNLERRYFARWHTPYGTVLDPSVVGSIRNAVRGLPSERQAVSHPGTSGLAAANSWVPVGPNGMDNIFSPGTYYSGRILDVAAPRDGATTRIAAASGGLWQYVVLSIFPIPVPMSDQLGTLVTGTFDAKPGDKNTIVLGTGEAWQRAGSGLFLSTDGGQDWQNVVYAFQTGAVFRVRFEAGSTSVVDAATERGLMRSTDGGQTWNVLLAGDISSVAVDPQQPAILYCTKWGDTLSGGVYRSANGGTSWGKIEGGLPTSNVGRSCVSICRDHPTTVYILLTRNDNDGFLGVYKTIDGGKTWTNVSPYAKDIGGNGWYSTVISVCPTSPDTVLVGMTQLMRSTDGGASWSVVDDPNMHVDQHAITWGPDGQEVWVGNDGGMAYSSDAGKTWSTGGNTFPITQYYHLDVNRTNSGQMNGGSQDNGLSVTTDGGTSWEYTFSGDGGGEVSDPNDPSLVYAIDGTYDGGILFHRVKSDDHGRTWNEFDNGITGDTNWAPVIRADGSTPPDLFTNASRFVYTSKSPYSTWTRLNETIFPYPVADVSVSEKGVVYACLDSYLEPRLMVYDGNAWAQRSAGLPDGIRIRTVVQHSSVDSVAYALMDGLGSPGAEIFKTTDHGKNWTNITGDLPDLPVSGLVAHPNIGLLESPVLYLGTEFGCYRSSNGGSNWERWNNGMPESAIVTEMTSIDSSAGINPRGGKFYVVAATFGRGVWKRDVSGDDPTAVFTSTAGSPTGFSLEPNYPDPFNATTVIRGQWRGEKDVRLVVYDLLGREVAVLANGRYPAGSYAFPFDGTNLASGVYFYRLTAGSHQLVRSMVLLK